MIDETKECSVQLYLQGDTFGKSNEINLKLLIEQ